MQKVWFITGASGGIGRSLSTTILASGDVLVAGVREPTKMADLASRYPDQVFIEQLDVTDRAAVQTVIERVSARHDVDVVVNNAGAGLIGATEEMTEEDIDGQIALLLLAPIQITRLFIPAFRDRRRGHFIQISSIGGQVAYPVNSPYHAAKFGLEGFSEAVAAELAGFGVKCTIVEPGATRTGFGRNLRFAQPMEQYRDSATGHVRSWIQSAGDGAFGNDPDKIARAIAETADMANPPLRLTLGGDAYDQIHAIMTDRLKNLETQESVARSVALD